MLKEIKIKMEGTVLILSDIHYPYTNMNLIKRIEDLHRPDMIVLLGDIIVKGSRKEFFSKLNTSRRIVFLQGDDDVVRADADILKLEVNGKQYTLLHGYQFSKNEQRDKEIVKMLKLIHHNLPLCIYCVILRHKLKLPRNETLILGHIHGLSYFKSQNCACAGTLTYLRNIYNDHGYLIIDKGIRIFRVEI